MKKLITGLVAGLGFAQVAYAQNPAFSTIRISWSAGETAAVPTMSVYALALLTALVTLVVYRLTRNQGSLLRMLAPVAALGIGALATVATMLPNSVVAGAPSQPPVLSGGNCSGTATYTATPGLAPPCFVNTCGQPVQVTYTFIDAMDEFGTPITEGNCTFNYFCPGESDRATDGASVPSDGASYGTAYCQEMFAPDS
ncbi:midcut-by-XrtH protein [Mangrovimicrobium sediminis]|uniref:Midcut-by-XrtH protein n=1 Tax=Mangrovimicrobium sediminis TaxID=2562682 RepID=A0A4Z0M6R6_9GAMM|nr:midcut-by-XrtH protein [Haliea sp. SAOS-164]TGD75100.1 midcut-by-XrtH protein [Haliea sp. SAOS-164]